MIIYFKNKILVFPMKINKLSLLTYKLINHKKWEAIFSAQKAKQLPLCKEHHKMLHANKLNKKYYR
jgi:hypothetical protein